MRILPLFIVLLGTSGAGVFGCGDYTSLNDVQTLARMVVSQDASQARQAISNLRARGPEGLQAFLDVHGAALLQSVRPDPKLRLALDAISGQRDAHAARLFWYTDLEQAKAAAQQLNRPILSLRLLGRLDEELSCANSRFFRIALYPNKAVNELLRQEFVLHWESERPAPRITVDFGDGRKIERTITGNSIHYVLAPGGEPIEALPGLFGPQAFLDHLKNAAAFSRQYTAAVPAARAGLVRTYHADRRAVALANWSADLARLAPGGSAARTDYTGLQQQTTAELWAAIARLHQDDARLAPESRTLMRAKNPGAVDAGRLALSKAAAEDPLLRAMGEFERSMGEDSVRNEYQLHTRIHEWFTAGGLDAVQLGRLNNRVYSELFLMPRSDPWFGLRPPNGYSGVESDGASLASSLIAQPR
jgi:hypothetical protein